MRGLDAKTAGAGVKLIIFMIVTTLATALLVVTIGNITFGASNQYRAVFSDVTGLNRGDDIRIAGVKVGTVSDIRIEDRNRALVSFSVDAEHTLDGGIRALIRYRNLVGQRYVSLQPGPGPAGALEEGDTIPIQRTKPALDLTVLFNGFQPLFEALNPDDVNKLSYEIIQVFQGEGGTVESLLSHTAEVTNTLADRDRVIGELIQNLNDVLTMLGDRDDELTSLINELQQFVTGLSQDRKPILDSLDAVNRLANETADLARDARPPVVRDVQELRRLTKVLDDNEQIVDRTLSILPIKLQKVGRTASYGSFFNFYVCNFTGRVRAGEGLNVPVNVDFNARRCDLS